MEKDYNAARCAAGKSSAVGAARIKGGYSLSAEREYPPLHPPRERALIGSFGLNDFYASGMGMPARGVAALELQDDLPLLLLSAAALLIL